MARRQGLEKRIDSDSSSPEESFRGGVLVYFFCIFHIAPKHLLGLWKPILSRSGGRGQGRFRKVALRVGGEGRLEGRSVLAARGCGKGRKVGQLRKRGETREIHRNKLLNFNRC